MHMDGDCESPHVVVCASIVDPMNDMRRGDVNERTAEVS